MTARMEIADDLTSVTVYYADGCTLNIASPIPMVVKQQAYAIAFTLVKTGIWQCMPPELA